MAALTNVMASRCLPLCFCSFLSPSNHLRDAVSCLSSLGGDSAARHACSATFHAVGGGGSRLGFWKGRDARRGLFTGLENAREEANAAGPLNFESPLHIVLYPDPRLRAKNKTINVFGEKLQKLAEEMFDVMYRIDGIGLSAPQVGVNVQLMVYNPEGIRGKGEEIVLVNPQIIKVSKVQDVYTEGCLSFPLVEADVERPVSVRVEARNIRGKKFSIHLKQLQARIFQHEYDHLQGTLFFERMTPEVLDSICLTLQKLEDDYEKRTGLPAPERIRDRSRDGYFKSGKILPFFN